jgi:hypothetical protein
MRSARRSSPRDHEALGHLGVLVEQAPVGADQGDQILTRLEAADGEEVGLLHHRRSGAVREEPGVHAMRGNRDPAGGDGVEVGDLGARELRVGHNPRRAAHAGRNRQVHVRALIAREVARVARERDVVDDCDHRACRKRGAIVVAEQSVHLVHPGRSRKAYAEPQERVREAHRTHGRGGHRAGPPAVRDLVAAEVEEELVVARVSQRRDEVFHHPLVSTPRPADDVRVDSDSQRSVGPLHAPPSLELRA